MIDLLVSTALAVSIVILIVLAVRGPVARHFGARAAYALWLAPLLRALWPLLPDFDLGQSATAVQGARSTATLVITEIPSVASASLMPLLAFAWAAGAALYLAVQVGRHRRFVRRALARGTALAPRGVPYDVIASDCVEGPVATGLIHPIILVPTDFAERFTPGQQRLALIHEQLHHRRGDIWASAAALVVTAMLWFNPFAHVALAAFRRDMEAACDSSVLAQAEPAEATAYAETILRCACRPVPRSLCALTSIDELKGRLTMLTLSHGRFRKIAGLAVAAVVVAGGAALSVPAVAHEPATKEIIEKRVIKHGSAGLSDAEMVEIEKLDHRCDGAKAEFEVKGGAADQKKQAKILVCSDKGTGKAGLIDAISGVLAKIDDGDPDMDPEMKANLKAQLEARLSELRAGK